MFTGIVEELGAVESIESRPAGARLKIHCQKVLADMTEGASIAVNGVCLTAVDLRPASFSADLAPETLRRSNLGALRALSRVNLERPLAPDGRLSGRSEERRVGKECRSTRCLSDWSSDVCSSDLLAPETLRRSNLGALRALSRVNLERPLAPDGRLSGHIVQGHVDATAEFLSLEALGDENWWLKVRVPAELDPYLVYKGSVAIDGISLTIAALEGDVLSVTIIPHTYRNTTLGTYQPGSRVNIECDILAKHVEKLIRNLDLKPRLTVERLRDEGY